MAEKFLPIPGYEEKYAVSDRGRVLSSWRRERILKLGIDRGGYLRVCLYDRHGGRQMKRVHQLVLAAFVGPCLPGREVNHRDGIKTNNRLENLEYMTPLENRHHASENGLTSHGEKHGSAKLSELQVRDIRRTYRWHSREFGTGALARKYGVSDVLIWFIVHGRNWRYLLRNEAAL